MSNKSTLSLSIYIYIYMYLYILRIYPIDEKKWRLSTHPKDHLASAVKSMTSMIGAKNKKNNLLIANQTGNYSKVDVYLHPSKNPTGTSSNTS